MKKGYTRKQVINELWRRGELHWKLKPNQKKVLDLVKEVIAEREHRKLIVHCSRRFGKSFGLCLLGVMVCLKIPHANVRYASSTQKSVRKMIMPIIKTILKDCPMDLKPSWNQADGCFRFYNGSELHVAGVNNGHEDDLRGTDAHLAIVDEAAFIDKLQYVVESVLMPQLITTDGILIMASSSPLSPAHEFASYIHEAKDQGNYASFNIYEADYDEQTIEEFKREAGGESSTTWRREYLNELIVDEETQIVPEWENTFCKTMERTEFFPYYQKQTTMDTGFRDKTAILFGYYDFKNARLVVEREYVVNGREVTSENIAKAVTSIEKELGYKDSNRIADNNDLIFLNDLQSSHGVAFRPTNKDSLHAMVNEVREWVKNGRVVIDPECSQLLGCIEYGVWNTSRKEFERSKAFGHYDALAALIYMVRNVDQHTNPIPVTHATTFDSFIPSQENSDNFNAFQQLFNKKN